MENGRSYDEVVNKAVEVVNSGITQRPDFDIDSLGEIKVCGAFCAFCGACLNSFDNQIYKKCVNST